MNKKQLVLFYSIVLVIAYLLESQYMAMLEDIQFCFDYYCNGKIVNVSDAFWTIVEEYKHWSGRVIPQFLAHCFAAEVFPLWLFFLTSAILFTFLLWGLSSYVKSKTGGGHAEDCLLLLLLFYLVPVIGRSFFGHVAFVLNYLWTSAIFCAYLLLLRKYHNKNTKNNIITRLIIVLLAFICGSFQESFSIPIGAFLFVELCIRRKWPKGNLAWLVYGFCAGALFSILAPGNFEKLSITENKTINDASNLNQIIVRAVYIFKHIYSLDLIIIIMTLWSIFCRKSAWAFVVRYRLLFVVIITNLLFAIFVAFTGEHQFVISGVCISVLLALLICQILDYIHITERVTLMTTIMLFCTTIIPVYQLRQECKESWDKFLATCLSSTDGLPVATELLQTIHKAEQMHANQFTNQYYMRWTIATHADPNYYYYLSNSITDMKDSTYIKGVLPYPKSWIVKNIKEKITPLKECGGYMLKVPANASFSDLRLVVPTASGKDASLAFGAFSRNSTFVEGDSRYIFMFQKPEIYPVKDIIINHN